ELGDDQRPEAAPPALLDLWGKGIAAVRMSRRRAESIRHEVASSSFRSSWDILAFRPPCCKWRFLRIGYISGALNWKSRTAFPSYLRDAGHGAPAARKLDSAEVTKECHPRYFCHLQPLPASGQC